MIDPRTGILFHRRKSFAGKLAIAFGLAMLVFAPAQAADKLTVVASAPSGSANVVVIGDAKGLFKAEGIDIEFTKVTGSAAVVPAVLSGSGDVGFTNLTASFYNSARNGDMTVIGGATRARSGYAQVIVLASSGAYDKGLKSAADLAGKTVGIAAVTGNSFYELYLLSEKYHFPMQGLSVKDLGSDANAVAALKSGAVDAAILGGTVVAVPMINSGEAKIIAETARESASLRDAIFTNQKTLATRRDVLVRFMRAYLKAAEYYSGVFSKRDAQGNLIRSAETDEILETLSKFIGQPVDGILQTLPYALPDAAIDQAEVTKYLRGWEALKLANPGIDPAKVLDLSILQAAAAK